MSQSKSANKILDIYAIRTIRDLKALVFDESITVCRQNVWGSRGLMIVIHHRLSNSSPINNLNFELRNNCLTIYLEL